MLTTCRKGLPKSFWLFSLLLQSSLAFAEGEKPGLTDRTQQAIAAKGDSVARWIDAFFDDPSVEEEEAESRLELRQSSTFSERDSSEYRVRVSAKLKLPNLSRRLSLTFAGNADEAELEDGAAHVFDDAEQDSLDDPTLGLQYIFQENKGYHGSFSVGTRLKNPSVNLGPRFRYQHQLSKNWRGRYTERFLWDTEDGWESRTALEFDRPLASENLFRQSLRADWRESRTDTQGVRYTLKSAFVQRLNNDAALSYEWSSRYTTRPRKSWIAHIVSTRYRRNVWRDWVFVEVSPFVAFEKKYGWHPNPGIRLSLDILFAQHKGE